jgi:translation initiation factor 5A
MSVEQAEVRQLKEGRFVVVDDEPCKILSITTSKPGKHGAAKARIDVVGLFDGRNRSVVYTTADKVKVPIIDKRKAQVISAHGKVAQLMDLESYEQFELPVPDELEGGLQPGAEIMYMEAMGRRMITRT